MAGKSDIRGYIKPGPGDDSLLKFQHKHRSEALWQHQISPAEQVLHCRRIASFSTRSQIDPRIVPYLRASGFYGVTCIGFFRLNWHLITAMVERWRPETHTFHLPSGECSITLEDVAVLTGLPINGLPVTSSYVQDSTVHKNYCEQLLGLRPPDGVITGSRLKMSWLLQHFGDLPDGATEYMVQYYARAYILRLLGGLLCSDFSGAYVHLMFLPLLADLNTTGQYSWGSACLAWLYRELCKATNPSAKEIGGASFIIQLWAWVRIPVLRLGMVVETDDEQSNDAPLASRWTNAKMDENAQSFRLREYRYALDRLGLTEMIWMPYGNEIIKSLPYYCKSGSDVWGAVVPLICFHIVEWHNADRVMRQYGFDQPIPKEPNDNDALHAVDLRGRDRTNWTLRHGPYINVWNNRRDLVVYYTKAFVDGMNVNYHSSYMNWYWKMTRRWVDHTGGAIGAVIDGIEKVNLMCSGDATAETLRQVKQYTSSMLGALHEEKRLIIPAVLEPPMEPFPITMVPDTTWRYTEGGSRRRTMSERRVAVLVDPAPARIAIPALWEDEPQSYEQTTTTMPHVDNPSYDHLRGGFYSGHASDVGPSLASVHSFPQLSFHMGEGTADPSTSTHVAQQPYGSYDFHSYMGGVEPTSTPFDGNIFSYNDPNTYYPSMDL